MRLDREDLLKVLRALEYCETMNGSTSLGASSSLLTVGQSFVPERFDVSDLRNRVTRELLYPEMMEQTKPCEGSDEECNWEDTEEEEDGEDHLTSEVLQIAQAGEEEEEALGGDSAAESLRKGRGKAGSSGCLTEEEFAGLGPITGCLTNNRQCGVDVNLPIGESLFFRPGQRGFMYIESLAGERLADLVPAEFIREGNTLIIEDVDDTYRVTVNDWDVPGWHALQDGQTFFILDD